MFVDLKSMQSFLLSRIQVKKINRPYSPRKEIVFAVSQRSIWNQCDLAYFSLIYFWVDNTYFISYFDDNNICDISHNSDEVIFFSINH